MALIRGKDIADLLYGTDEADYIDGLLGNDELYGGSGGDDEIEAGPATPVAGFTDDDVVYGDTFAGGATNDWIRGGYGNDTLYGDSLFGGGGGNDTLEGGLGNDILHGGDGNDRLDGGPGADQMFGGSGNDQYVVDSASDVVTESASGGSDGVSSYIDYTLGANVENLSLYGSSAINGTGNNLDNVIGGSETASNFLYGRLGNDTILGREGNDNLDGGEGDDTLYGGYTFDSNDGDDYLNGRSGADKMYGGGNNDKYVVDNASDLVIENASMGTDTVVSTINYTLGANVENLTLTDAAVNGTGNELSNYMLGNGSDNLISAKGGDDLINGRGGNDVIVGGAGNDTLYGDLGADKFRFEFQSEGIDLIRDFNRSEGDKIQIVKSSFGATSLDQFSYNSTTGALLFGSTQLATITNKPAGFSVQTDVILS